MSILVEPIIHARQISKNFKIGDGQIQVLNEMNLEICQGDTVCFLGASGAGKSTLLQILGTLDQPTTGEVLVEGHSVFKMNDDELSLFRSEKMGFVFQFHHLIQELSALENVILPCLLAGESRAEAEEKGKYWLSQLGLSERMNHFPYQMSGGELQRTAIARSLIRNPKILFADEPTGNLDSENSKIIHELFFQLQKQLGLTLIVVTHDLQFSKMFSKVYFVKDGCLTSN